MAKVTPQEVAKLLCMAGITKEDVWDPERARSDDESGGFNDLIKFVYMPPESHCVLLPQQGREGMRQEWLVIIPEFEDLGDQFWLDLLDELENPEYEVGPYGVEGAGRMTAGQHMDALHAKTGLQQYERREYLVGIRRGQYNLNKGLGHIPPETTFKEFCEGDYWLVSVEEDEGLELWLPMLGSD